MLNVWKMEVAGVERSQGDGGWQGGSSLSPLERPLPAHTAWQWLQSRAMTTLLATTIAGSLPKPAWLAEPNQLWAPWKLEGDALVQGKQDAVRLALFDQEHAGIDIVTDGEQTRRHFVTTFIE